MPYNLEGLKNLACKYKNDAFSNDRLSYVNQSRKRMVRKLIS